MFLIIITVKKLGNHYYQFSHKCAVIKKPMDLGTIGKKLKNQEYNSKQKFVDDLNLIFTNCFTYNTAEESIYRQHIQMLRDKWTYLLKTVPEIVMPSEANTTDKKKTNTSSSSQSYSAPAPVDKNDKTSTSIQSQVLKQQPISNDPLDDLDDLLNAHLESLSDSESCPSPKKLKKSTSASTKPISPATIITDPYPKHSYVMDLSEKLPKRCDKLMIQYASDSKSSWGTSRTQAQKYSNEQSSDSCFVFPELVYFFNTIPDTHLIKRDRNQECANSASYSSIKSMNRYYDNFRILQSIRELRKHILESSRADVPSIDSLKSPSSRFDSFQAVFDDPVENGWQAKVILRKVITLYLAQAGFEGKIVSCVVYINMYRICMYYLFDLVISNSALHALYEFVEWNFKKFFDILKLFNENFSKEKDSADILRLALLQMNIRHLSDLEVTAVEDSYAKSRLESLLNVVCEKLQDYQSTIRVQSDERAVTEESNEITEEQDDDLEDQEDTEEPREGEDLEEEEQNNRQDDEEMDQEEEEVDEEEGDQESDQDQDD